MVISNIRLVSADNFITPQLLTKLSINDRSTLRYDHYHLINNVWPRVSSFGEVKLSQILHYLNEILINYTEDYGIRHIMMSR